MLPKTLADLRGMDIEALERCFQALPLVPLSGGRFRGVHLRRLNTPGARKFWVHAFQKVTFEWASWGIDFTECAWFFYPAAHFPIAHFIPRQGRSRWRDTQAMGMHYHVSRLPIRSALYDEIKPIHNNLMLGLGGLNAGRDEGDHFFFALERL